MKRVNAFSGLNANPAIPAASPMMATKVKATVAAMVMMLAGPFSGVSMINSGLSTNANGNANPTRANRKAAKALFMTSALAIAAPA